MMGRWGEGAMVSQRSTGSASCHLSTTSVIGKQGVARCALCHALVNLFTGRQSMQTFMSATELPRPSPGIVEDLLALRLTEADQVSLCRFHQLHKSRYELWTHTHTRVRNFAAGTGTTDGAVDRLLRFSGDIAQMEEHFDQADARYLEAIGCYLKQLQQDVRNTVVETLNGKAQEFIDSCQNSVDEVDEQIDKKIDERRQAMCDALTRSEESAREDFWRQHQRKMKQKIAACADESRNMQTWKRGGYTKALQEKLAFHQAMRSSCAVEMQRHVGTKVTRERIHREKEMDVWLAKMDELREHHHDQAEKDRARLYDRLEKTMQKWDEEQVIEFRQIMSRFQQHTTRVQRVLDKINRGQSVRLRAENGIRLAELEPFAQLVVRSEMHSVGLGSVGGELLALQNSGEADDDSAGEPGSATAGAQSASEGGTLIPQHCTLELSAFAEFLGARFPTLRTAFASMDITGTGRLACFELKTWLTLQNYPGDARLLLKELDQKTRGRVELDDLRPLAKDFLRGSLSSGRPPGLVGASMVVRLFWAASGGSGRSHLSRGTFEANLAALFCACRILSFVSPAASRAASSAEMRQVLPSTGETPEPLEISLAMLMSSSSASLATSSAAGYGGGAASSSLLAKAKQNTDIGRWARSIVEPDVAQRFSHMRCGLAGPSPKAKAGPTPPRGRQSSVERFNSEVSKVPLQAPQDWGKSLRSGGERPRRGAPPPKCNFKESLLKESSRSASSDGGGGKPSSAGRKFVPSPIDMPSSARARSAERRNLSSGPSVSRARSNSAGAQRRAASAYPPMRPTLALADEDRQLSTRSGSARQRSHSAGSSSSPPRKVIVGGDGGLARSNSRRRVLSNDGKEVEVISSGGRARSPPLWEEEPLPLPSSALKSASKHWKWGTGSAGKVARGRSGSEEPPTSFTPTPNGTAFTTQQALPGVALQATSPVNMRKMPVPRIASSSAVQYVMQTMNSSSRSQDRRSLTPTVLPGTPSTPGLNRTPSLPTTPGVQLQKPATELVQQLGMPLAPGQVLSVSSPTGSVQRRVSALF
mmetsp:Transcript_83708/g.144719  ORF Transcript_83708/g.144719 Transcript_83708/m.144719 type:complete len:1045 (+) Transcript_83708:50-3184(+)